MTQDLRQVVDSIEMIAASPAWVALRDAATVLGRLQSADGSVPADDRDAAAVLVGEIAGSVAELAPAFPHDSDYLDALQSDLHHWVEAGLGVPDFVDSLQRFHPQQHRVDGLGHLVVFPMFTQNGSTERHLEAVLLRVVWPDFVADLEAGEYGNPAFVPVGFVDFTPGYDTHSAVLFPETVASGGVAVFGWGAIFCDREAARFRRILGEIVETTGLELPGDVAELLADQRLMQETFVLWDLIHDRAHSRGDLPFDPFMIKQRMPYWLYSLEELRCDLNAFRACVELGDDGVRHAQLAQYAILLDRALRFPLAGSRVRNYDGLGGQLLFAYLHQHGTLNWTDNRLSVDWAEFRKTVLALLDEIEELYWRSIDRNKVAHWIAAYELVSTYVSPNPASTWAKGPDALPLDGPPKGLVDAVLPDEFPLSMFFEALSKKLGDAVESTRGIRA